MCLLPTTFHIAMAKIMVADNVKVGSQNVFMHGTGTYTGEIAAEHLKYFNLEWAIVGRSERRSLYGENSNVIGTKVSNSLEQGFDLILCIGETFDQREFNSTNDMLKEQLD
ncbi:unnamed protein product [Moneuplotes crassus]|uniref:Triosephosphate isomerase n=1 Tax=Euplotes crassus TaxID=5936 RepID=A0AAD1UGC5_EUPCR|nr:unnamed protein product [Moneuplotes crassus]